MDPFEVRMQFLTLLRRLNASQQSIQKVVGYAMKHFPPCGEDLWDCIVEECQKGSINSRINILYFLDSLCETCLLAKSYSKTVGPDGNSKNFYVDFVARDLGIIVENVVPEGRQGLPNLISTKQILENWRIKRVIDPQKVDEVVASLGSRSTSLDDPTENSPSSRPHRSTAPATSLPRSEIFKRIEEDRERHKRLRERRWVQPTLHNNSSSLPPQLASFIPMTDDEEQPVDIEFENDWETTSNWNEDDDEAALEEYELCFPSEGGPMDLS